MMAANAQTESAFMDPVTLLGEDAQYTPVAVSAGTVFCESANVKMEAAWEDSYKIASVSGGNYITIDGEAYSTGGQGVQGSSNPKDNSLLSGGQNSGAVYKFEVATNGYLYVFGNFTYNKNYYVWEGDVANGAGKAMAYTLQAYASGGTEVGYTLPADKFGYYAAMGYVKGVANFSSNEAYDDGTRYKAAGTIAGNWSSGSAVGVISFPVRKSAGQYYVNACGSKLVSKGFVFVPIPPKTVDVTINEVGYATLFLDYSVTIPEGIEAYTGTINGKYLTLTPVEGIIPDHTAVILKASEGTYTFEESDPVEDVIEDNVLEGGTGLAAADGDLVLGVVDDVVGFYSYTGTLATNKAYIPASKVASASGLRLVFEEEGEATGIATLRAEENATSIFDLAGRRTNAKGLIIKNGKVVLVK